MSDTDQLRSINDFIKYGVTVSALSRRGRRTLQKFTFMSWGHWYRDIAFTRRQLEAALAAHAIMMRHVSGDGPHERGWIDDGPPQLHTYPPGALESDPTALFPLADGVDIRTGSLAVILHALRWANKPEVDIADIKVVVSQLGSDLNRSYGLPDDQRLQAIFLLRPKIAKLCTTLT